MKFRAILTLILALAGGAAVAQQAASDDTILDMAQAFRNGNKAPLAQLLPPAAGRACRARAARRASRGPRTGNCARAWTRPARRRSRTSSPAMPARTRKT